jgi:outer membrane protein OmpA-like peptidoglycan-associated protein
MNVCQKAVCRAVLLCCAFVPVNAQTGAQNNGQAGANGARAVRIDAQNSDSSSIVEKSDWMRYDNGKYIGHVYREVRASIVALGGTGDAKLYKGHFFVMEDTLRDMRSSAKAVNAMVPAQFRMFRDGSIEIDDDKGFPALRDFPVYANKAVEPGEKWTAPGERALDPLNDGSVVVVPFLAEYEYKGIELYNGIPVHRISARYASRYNFARIRPITFTNNYEKGLVQPFTGLSGKHDVDILIRVSNGALLLSRDNLDETFTWADGKTVRFRGFTLVFGQGIQPMNKDAVIAGISPGIEGANGISVSKVDEGIRLTLQDIQFKPDSSELLAGETERLKVIAAALAAVHDRTFLVEGHTAQAGTAGGEQELSVARAKRIVDELCALGMEAGRFSYKGWGSAKPAASNSTEEGRKLNRRVEITIIE